MTKPATASLFSRFRLDRRGASAVEFAMIAPVLIAMYAGLAEYCQATMADRKATHVASSIGDLVAQSSQVTTNDLDDIFSVGQVLMIPFPSTKLTMRVASVTVSTATGAPTVDWGRGAGGATGRKKGDVVSTFPESNGKPFVAKGESVVMAEVTYTYDSPIKYFVKNGIVFEETFYLRPRKSAMVACTDCPP